MANTISAAKNARKAQKRHESRVAVKSELKTLRKKVVEIAKSKASAEEIAMAAKIACKKYAKAGANRAIHPKTASRKISRLMKHVHKLQQPSA